MYGFTRTLTAAAGRTVLTPQSSWVLGGALQNPGNVQVTTNSSICDTNPPPTGSPRECGENLGQSGQTYLYETKSPGSSAYFCKTFDAIGNTYTNPWSGGIWLVYNNKFRVWLHQDANGNGWADCFSAGIWYIGNTRDANPGNMQFSTNNSSCLE